MNTYILPLSNRKTKKERMNFVKRGHGEVGGEKGASMNAGKKMEFFRIRSSQGEGRGGDSKTGAAGKQTKG